MLCSAAIYTFSAVTTYMNGSGEGESGALVSWLFCDFLLCLWCSVGSAIGMESINQSIIQFSIQIFLISQLFI